MTDKEIRNKRIIDMHNGGSTIQDIVAAVGMSKGGVHKVLSNHIGGSEVAPKKVSIKVKLTGNEEVFNNFSGWARTDVNQYAHKDTGEIVNLAFIPADSIDGYGIFVKVN
jgi:hypothetical protein